MLAQLQSNADCIYLGDINLSLLDESEKITEYSDLLTAKGFISANNKYPTRVTDGGASLIDRTYYRQHNFYGFHVEVKDSKGVSDHKLITMEFFCTKNGLPNHRVIKTIDYAEV